MSKIAVIDYVDTGIFILEQTPELLRLLALSHQFEREFVEAHEQSSLQLDCVQFFEQWSEGKANPCHELREFIHENAIVETTEPGLWDVDHVATFGF